MRNMVSQRRRSGRSGFIRLAHTDTNEPEQRQLSGRARSRETVQQVLQQTPSPAPHDINPLSAQSSPALSDASIIKEDYMSLPTQQFDDVDLTDIREGYAEVLDSYGPEVADNADFASDFYSIKAGKGLEVCIESYPLDLSPGLCVDDHLEDYSYRGSEGDIEKPTADFSSPYNYRPVPLRWRFILIVFGGLVAFLALSELSLRFLPDASDMNEFLPAFQNISEIRKRSGHHDDGGHGGHFTGPDNGTQADIPSIISSTTEASSSTKMSSSIIGISRTTEIASITSSTKSIPTTPTTSIASISTTSSSTDTASTTKVTQITSTTSMIETPSITKASSSTEIASTIESSLTTKSASTTEASPTTSTTLTTSTIKIISPTETRGTTTTISITSTTKTTTATSATSIFEITSTPETISTTSTTETTSATSASSIFEITSTSKTISTPSTPETTEPSKSVPTTEPNSPTSVENQTTSPMKSSTIETVAASTSKQQDSQSSVTSNQVTEVTITKSENKPSEITTLSLSQTSASQPPVTEYPHYTTTEQHTISPTPNDPGPGDHSSPEGHISSTHTRLDVTSTTDHETSPIPSPSQVTTALQETTNLPSSPTVGSSHSNASGQSSDITLPNPLPGLGIKPTDSSSLGPNPINTPLPSGSSTTSPGKPTGSSSSGPDPLNTPLPSGSSTTSPSKQATDEHSSQGSSQPTDVKPPDSLYPTVDQPKAQPTDNGKGQSGDQPAGPNNDDARVSLSSIHNVKPVVTSSQTIPTVDATRTTKEKTDSFSAPTKLPESSEQNFEENNKPFITFTLTQTAETPLPISTSVFTTSSSVSGGSFVEVTMMTTIFGHIKAADPLTDFVTTSTYANGMVSTISKSVYDKVFTETDYDSAGKPTGTRYIHVLNSARPTTLKNSLGYATATVDYYDVESTVTLYNSDHIATATVATIIPETMILSTMYDNNGRPIETTMLLRPILTNTEIAPPTPSSTSSSGSNSQPTLELHRLSDEIYFVGLMLPTLLTILLFVPIKILNRNVKLYQGFHVLASDRGAGAAESLCLGTTGPTSFLGGLWSLQRGSYLLGLTSVLVILSALAVPFSAEAFRLILQGPQCRADESKEIKCSVTLGVFPAPAQVLSALLILLIIGIVLVAALLRRWNTGVEWDPWNILHMAQLAAGTDVRKVLERLRQRQRHDRRADIRVDAKEFINKLHGKTLGLREWEENGARKYSVLILTKEVEDLAEKPANKAGRSVAFANPNARQRRRLRWPSGDHVPFSILSLTGRILFMFFLSGVLIAVLTYDIVARGSEYRRGLTGKAVGVRFLFSGAGVIVSFAWGSFFNAVAFLSPYKLLQRRRLNKGEAIAISPATNPFTGLWLAIVPSRRDLFLGVVAATSVVSEFLPLFLGNIPCNGVQLEIAETVSVYLSVAVLSMMIFIVGGSFFIDWPTTMGADPSTIAGAMYIAHVLSVAQPMRRFFKNEIAGIV